MRRLRGKPRRREAKDDTNQQEGPSMSTHTDERTGAQGRSTPWPRTWRNIRPTAPPKNPPSPEQIAAQIKKQFAVRIERAIGIIAREHIPTRAACRRVGLIGSTAEAEVKRLCDVRGVPRWKASERSRALLQLRLPLKPRPDRAVRKETYRRVNAWRRDHANRARELSMVAHAIQTYELERGTICERCGSDKNICAGPVTLAPRLRVTWWCRRCSRATRRK